MSKRYQVFISSTFTDMHEERQAAVEAILEASHMPAGMELFTSGSGAQLEVIKEWIRESDVYMLVLGGRYGSLDKESGLSYTEIEFNYAKELGKPVFSVVIDEAALNEKVKRHGTGAVETDHGERYKKFREVVLTEICAFYSDVKDIKLAVHRSLHKVAKKWNPDGWVKASTIVDSGAAASQIALLVEENRGLRRALEAAERKAMEPQYAGLTFDSMVRTLSAIKIHVPAKASGASEDGEATLIHMFVANDRQLAPGVTNGQGANAAQVFLFGVASRLLALGLTELDKVPAGVYWQRIRLSKEGVRFLTEYRARAARLPKESPHS